MTDPTSCARGWYHSTEIMSEPNASGTVPAYIHQISHKRELAASGSVPESADNTRYATSVGPMDSEEIEARLSALRRDDCQSARNQLCCGPLKDPSHFPICR